MSKTNFGLWECGGFQRKNAAEDETKNNPTLKAAENPIKKIAKSSTERARAYRARQRALNLCALKIDNSEQERFRARQRALEVCALNINNSEQERFRVRQRELKAYALNIDNSEQERFRARQRALKAYALNIDNSEQSKTEPSSNIGSCMAANKTKKRAMSATERSRIYRARQKTLKTILLIIQNAETSTIDPSSSFNSSENDISEEDATDTIKSEDVNPDSASQDDSNSLHESSLTKPADKFIKIEPADLSSYDINTASTSNFIYHNIKEEAIIEDEDFEKPSTSHLNCDITSNSESADTNIYIKIETPDSPSHEDNTVSSTNIKDEPFEVKSEPFVEQTLTKSQVIERIQTVGEELDLITNRRREQELQISSIEDPTLLQPLHNVLENIVREETNKQLELEDLQNMLHQLNY